jgi:hypothetical protein
MLNLNEGVNLKKRKLLLIVILLLILSLCVSVAYATGSAPTYVDGTFNCNQVTFDYVANFATVNFRVVDDNDQVVSNLVTGINFGPDAITLQLEPEQEPGTVLQIQFDWGDWEDFGPATACAGTGSTRNQPPPPAWQHFGGGDAYAAFRFFEDPPGNPIMLFLSVENDGYGNVAFFISQKMLDENFPCDGTTKTLYHSADGIYSLYLLPDCGIQANVGPDFEGKMHVIQFDTIPPGDSTRYWTIDAAGKIAQRVVDPFVY